MTPGDRSFGEEHAQWCELAAETLRASGKLRLRVTGWSMFPSVRPGDTLMIERAAEARVGEIVLYRRDGRLVVHRVVRKNGAGVVTRGDAMTQVDPEEKELLGRVRFISRDGRFLEAGRFRMADRAVGAMMARSRVAARMMAGWHARRSSAPGPQTSDLGPQT